LLANDHAYFSLLFENLLAKLEWYLFLNIKKHSGGHNGTSKKALGLSLGIV